MQTYTFTTPFTINLGLNATQTIKSVQLTGFTLSTTPPLGEIGTGLLSVTLTDPATGWQEAFPWDDTTAISFGQTAAIAPASGDQLCDTIAKAVFTLLTAKNLIPAGTLATA